MLHILRQHVREDGCEENKVERRSLERETIFGRLVFPVGVIGFVVDVGKMKTEVWVT